MAARLRPEQNEKSRAAIQATQLVKRLQAFALNETDAAGNMVELDANRLRAIEILLRKSLPDLSAITLSGDEERPLYVASPRERLKDLLDRSSKPG